MGSAAVRVLAAVACAAVLVGVVPGTALAAPERMCALGDRRLAEVSGVVTTSTGYIVVNDGGDQLRMFVLDRSCRVTRTVGDRTLNPFDPEDLGRERDGTLWVADIGDNDRERTSIAVHRLAPRATRAQLLRMTYPDGPHDAEALVVQPDGRVVVVTKEALGPAGVYRSVGPPRAGATVPMTRVGSLTLEPTGTEGGPPGLGRVAQTAVTGAALSPDRRHVVVRTYTDAYEWDITGDVAGMLVAGKPRRTPLPGEPQGESIAYTMDGKAFVTVSEGATSAVQRWVPNRPAPPPATAAPPPRAEEPASGGSGVSLRQLTQLVLGIGVLGLVLVVVGVVGIVRFRRERERERELRRHGGERPEDVGGRRGVASAARVDLREPGMRPRPGPDRALRPRRPDEDTVSLTPPLAGRERRRDDREGSSPRRSTDRNTSPGERDGRRRPPDDAGPWRSRAALPDQAGGGARRSSGAGQRAR